MLVIDSALLPIASALLLTIHLYYQLYSIPSRNGGGEENEIHYQKELFLLTLKKHRQTRFLKCTELNQSHFQSHFGKGSFLRGLFHKSPIFKKTKTKQNRKVETTAFKNNLKWVNNVSYLHPFPLTPQVFLTPMGSLVGVEKELEISGFDQCNMLGAEHKVKRK